MAKKKEAVIFYAGIGISLLFVAYAAVKMDFAKALEVILSANVIWLLPITVLNFVTFYFRALRWRYILQQSKEIPVLDVYSALCIGFMANMVLPMRAGELIRAYVISKKEQLSLSNVFGTIVLERMLDLFATIVLLVIVLFVASPPNISPEVWVSLKKGGATITVLFVMATLFLVMMVHNYTKFTSFMNYFYRILPTGLSGKIENLLDSFKDGLKTLEEGKHVFAAGIYNIFVWICIFAMNFSLLAMFDIDVSLEMTLVISLFIVFGVMVPSSPGFVGPLHAAIIIALGLYGIQFDEALGIAIVIHLVIFFLLVIPGFFFLWYSGLSFSKIRQTGD